MTTTPSSIQRDAAVPEQYDRWARVYDRFWRRYMNRTLPVVQQMADVRTGEQVLDLACGTGELLHRIAQTTPSADLTGVDLSLAMVGRAQRKLQDVANAQVEPADAHHLPFEDAS
jgi:ubiquinone/menaquinone biosynthesis C-methylase UbiE